jgi:DNA-binding GntR family transcriptional regulator
MKGAGGLTRRHLGQEAFSLLRRMITEGELVIGERLVEERLAERLGLSRTPVREALHRLEQEGLLLKRPRGGYEVSPLTPEEVADALGVRGVLEAYAAELAAKRVTAKQLKDMERNLAQFEEALAKMDEKRLVELNVRFHELLYQAAASKLLYRILSELQDEVERISHLIMSNMAAGAWSAGDHRALVEALAAGDVKAARKAALAHVQRGADWLVSRLKDQTADQAE